MGTRADFYVGRGETAEWLGSIAWDGYPDGIDQAVLEATTEGEYRQALMEFFANDRDDVTGPDHGWPWPWDNSQTTDYAYAFDDDKVWASCFGHGWFDPTTEPTEPDPEYPGELRHVGETSGKTAVFPDMSDKKNVAWDNRSGLMIFQARDE